MTDSPRLTAPIPPMSAGPENAQIAAYYQRKYLESDLYTRHVGTEMS